MNKPVHILHWSTHGIALRLPHFCIFMGNILSYFKTAKSGFQDRKYVLSVQTHSNPAEGVKSDSSPFQSTTRYRIHIRTYSFRSTVMRSNGNSIRITREWLETLWRSVLTQCGVWGEPLPLRDFQLPVLSYLKML